MVASVFIIMLKFLFDIFLIFWYVYVLDVQSIKQGNISYDLVGLVLLSKLLINIL